MYMSVCNVDMENMTYTCRKETGHPFFSFTKNAGSETTESAVTRGPDFCISINTCHCLAKTWRKPLGICWNITSMSCDAIRKQSSTTVKQLLFNGWSRLVNLSNFLLLNDLDTTNTRCRIDLEWVINHRDTLLESCVFQKIFTYLVFCTKTLYESFFPHLVYYT